MAKIYDIIILGGGPAGLSAYLYATRKKLNTALITKEFGGQMNLSSSVENYLGFKEELGIDLAEKFVSHIEDYDGDVFFNENIISLEKEKTNIFKIKTDKNEYLSKTVTVATGRIPRTLGVPGENQFIGKGIAFCATCDAPMFLDQDVLVVGGGNSAFDAVLQLIEYAKKIYVADVADTFFADPILIEKAKNSGKVTFLHRTAIQSMHGDDFINKVKLTDLNTKKNKELAVSGVFIEIGSIPKLDYIKFDIDKNNNNEIKINSKTETNIDGIFACGDVTNVYGKQIIIAAGEGAKSALAIYDFLSKK